MMEAIKETVASGNLPWNKDKKRKVEMVEIKIDTTLFPTNVEINVVSNLSLKRRMSFADFFPESASAMYLYRLRQANDVSDELKNALRITKTIINVILSQSGILSKPNHLLSRVDDANDYTRSPRFLKD